jgi:hypothetical protein
MRQADKAWTIECLAGYYEEWDKLTPDQQTIMVLEVHTRMEEDGLNTSQAISELEHFRIKGKLLKYVLELQIIALVD